MNPNQIISMMLQNNPAIRDNPLIKSAFDMMQNGNSKGLQSLVENVAREKGINLDELIQQLKSNMRI